jgi:hypothetical protein
MKYKQKIIPSVSTQWGKLTAHELRYTAFEYYRKLFAGKSVNNQATGFSMHFTVKGGRQLVKGGNIYQSKAELVRILDSIMEQAELSN